MAERPPLVSVVTATYNRSHVLRAAITALRRQTLADWEQIIVGDACSDDTGRVIASFADPRLRFVNLERNCRRAGRDRTTRASGWRGAATSPS